MNVIRITKYYYISLTIFLIFAINSTTLDFSDVYPAMFIMWINFIMLYFGYYLKINTKLSLDNKPIKFYFERKKILIIIITVFFSLAAVYFYTGQTLFSTIKNLMAGNSLYFMYQKYFQVNQIAEFSIKKIPYIFMLFFIEVAVIYSYIYLLVIKINTTLKEKMFLLILSFAFLFVGLARGTNFELFQFIILIVFVIMARKNRKNMNIKMLFFLSILIVFVLIIFSFIISSRGDVGYFISQEIRYDPNELFSHVSPAVSLLISKLVGYFGFGFYYVTTFISKIWLSSSANFILGIIPFGLSGVNLREKIEGYIDLSVCWIPDVAGFINIFGLTGLFLICFFIGRFLKYINIYNNSKNSLTQMINFWILVQMVSLPVGNFIITSSANKLFVLFLLFLWFVKFLRRILKVRVVGGSKND